MLGFAVGSSLYPGQPALHMRILTSLNLLSTVCPSPHCKQGGGGVPSLASGCMHLLCKQKKPSLHQLIAGSKVGEVSNCKETTLFLALSCTQGLYIAHRAGSRGGGGGT